MIDWSALTAWSADLGLPEILLLMAIVLIAGAVRGYAGFGLSAVTVTLGSIWFEPITVVPVLFLLEIVASIHMLKSVHREIDWSLLRGLLLGCAVGMPLGQVLLLLLPADATRVALYLVVIVAVGIVQFGYTFRFGATWKAGVAIGIAAGLSSGLASLGGLVTMVALLGIAYDVIRARATLVAMFFALYIYGTGVGVLNGVMTVASLQIAAVMILPLIVGVAVGQKGFLLTSRERFRQIMLRFLAVMAVIGILRVSLDNVL